MSGVGGDITLTRLRWRCRRGMLELDLLLEGFLANGYAALDRAERTAFARLLECADQDLHGYFFTGAAPDDPHLAHVIARIRRAAGSGV